VSPDVYIYQDPVNYFNSKYLIVALSAIQPSGVASIESVRDDVTPLVRNQKKGQQLAGKISGTDLNAIAGQFNTEVDSAQNITFVSTFVPGLGNEPKVIAEAFKLSRDQISSPIIGENGVYVIKVTDKIEDATDPNISVLRQQASAQLRAAVSSRLIESLRKNAKIKDYRSTYY
ncbi:MAG: peptidyl-prolyl cis-trans isomerase, partial [Saprospiraceae bacterium]|nr:peptidyl-prolyl cis-trans isomerase [Saprospiraceae bacterium]